MTGAPPLLSQVDGDILILTLNRPDKLNAISHEMMALLEQEVLRFRDTPELKVALIRSTGRYFCAGADMRGGLSTSPRPTTARGYREMHRVGIGHMHRVYDEMEAIEKPFVVAHHATCVGGGLEMSLSCDFRLAAKSASYSFPEAKFAMLPASNGISRLTRLVGTGWARYMVMANKPVDADRAFIMGLVQEVFPDESFEQDVMDFCRHLARHNGEQMGAAKIAIEMARDVGLAQARNVERMANASLMLNPDYNRIREAYVEALVDKSKRD
jgi:enoyl-CoA hydratase/carnithine racemase